MNDTNNVNIIKEITNKYLTGILLLQGNKSCGRHKGTLLYKCVPSRKDLPHFYIPYEIKLRQHSKNIKNKYVEFYFVGLGHGNKYIGMLTETFGDIDDIDAFYYYEAAKYELRTSCKLSSTIKKWYGKGVFVEEYFDKYYSNLFDTNEYDNNDDKYAYNNYNNRLISRQKRDYIITVDPIGSKDLDDAIGYYKDNDKIVVSTYITCVPIIMDIIHNYSEEPSKTTSVYLPNKVIPMLPKCLSENICSLIKKRHTKYSINL